MSDGAKKVEYKPLFKGMNTNFFACGRFAKAARSQGISGAAPRIAARVPASLTDRFMNPLKEYVGIGGNYERRLLTRGEYLMAQFNPFSGIHAASMQEAVAIQNGEVVAGGCAVKGQRKSVGVVQEKLGNPMGRMALQEERAMSAQNDNRDPMPMVA